MKDFKQALSASAREKLEEQEEVAKQMTKADLKNIEEDDKDAVFEASEELAFEWIEFFLSDVNRIERFFKDKQD
jgi:2,4-dienoyl-CoA reductase-like NADH-dependent reductase (Old Yellow Enzyme family)